VHCAAAIKNVILSSFSIFKFTNYNNTKQKAVQVPRGIKKYKQSTVLASNIMILYLTMTIKSNEGIVVGVLVQTKINAIISILI
jgi:accessory gene regulator protein AgrB